MVFFFMVDIDKEISDEWKSPHEGYNDDVEEDADLESVRFGMNSFDRLISSIGNKEMLGSLSKIV